MRFQDRFESKSGRRVLIRHRGEARAVFNSGEFHPTSPLVRSHFWRQPDLRTLVNEPTESQAVKGPRLQARHQALLVASASRVITTLIASLSPSFRLTPCAASRSSSASSATTRMAAAHRFCSPVPATAFFGSSCQFRRQSAILHSSSVAVIPLYAPYQGGLERGGARLPLTRCRRLIVDEIDAKLAT